MLNLFASIIQTKSLPDGLRVQHQVLQNQNMFDIALKYDCNVWKIKELNNLQDLHIIQGQYLEVIDPQNTTEHYSYIDRQYLLTLDFNVEIIYLSNQYQIKGSLRITHDYLTFQPIFKKMHPSIKNEPELYSFTLYFKEIHKIKYNPISQVLQLYLWGVNGMQVPIMKDDQYEIILIELKQNNKKTKLIKPIIKKLCKLGTESSKLKTMEALSFLLYLIHYEHEKVIQDSFNNQITDMKFNVKPIQCNSFAFHLHAIQIHMDNGFIISTSPMKQKQNQEQFQYIPKLSEESRVINEKQTILINQGLPQYLQMKDWFLIYSINKHGTSQYEFLRRTESIGPHILILKDQNKKIFGAYVSESWKLSKDSFYGSGESFLFSFDNNQIQIFKTTQKNNCYQMADETGFSLGAGDRYGLFIKHDLSKGSSFPCETYNNICLSSQNNFTIYEFELWAMDQESLNQLKFIEQKRSLFH